VTRALAPLIAKEIRALLPLWGGTMLALAAAFVWRGRSYSDLALLGYVFGVVTLGAHAVGHEYGLRTLPMLLAQPVPRSRIFATKFLVLLAMLVTVATAAAMAFAADRFRGNDSVHVVILPILAALFTTPLFTMICRNTLAGAVLGVSGPMTLWVLAMLVAWAAFGIPSHVVTSWFLEHWMAVAIIVSPFLAALTWRAFNRIEAIEGMPATLTMPRWVRARTGIRRRSPWRALFAKELHLQQMTIAITLFYGVIWVAGVALRQQASPALVLPLEAVLLLYCLGLAIVIGALASAEERQQGTLEVQLLQPFSSVKQWIAKCTVALSLALLLGIMLPAVLIGFVTPPDGSPAMLPPLGANIVLLVIVLTASSLYISTLVTSGVKAMAWSLPVGIGAAIFIQTAQGAIVDVSTRLGAPLPVDQTEAAIVASGVLTVLIVPVLLWFGYVNHTSAQHPLRRTLTQVGVLAALIVTGVIAGGMLM
jgi:ABC-type transport system involved in multi-copper enzyme maturation permease subunit